MRNRFACFYPATATNTVNVNSHITDELDRLMELYDLGQTDADLFVQGGKRRIKRLGTQ